MSPRAEPPLAGALAATVWGLLEPLDQRLLRCDYSDVAVLGKAVTRGPLWRPVGLALHAANGAAFGLAFDEARTAHRAADPQARRWAWRWPSTSPCTRSPGSSTATTRPAARRGSRRSSRNPRAFAAGDLAARGLRRRAGTARRALGGGGQGRRTARRGPARKPASTSSGSASLSVTGSPSKRSTASRFARPRLHVLDQRGQGRPQPLVLGIAQRHDRLAAALDEQRGQAAEQNDVRAGDAGRTRARPLRPRQRGAVGLGRVGRGEHERIHALVAQAPAGARAAARPPPPRANCAPPSPSTK